MRKLESGPIQFVQRSGASVIPVYTPGMRAGRGKPHSDRPGKAANSKKKLPLVLKKKLALKVLPAALGVPIFLLKMIMVAPVLDCTAVSGGTACNKAGKAFFTHSCDSESSMGKFGLSENLFLEQMLSCDFGKEEKTMSCFS